MTEYSEYVEHDAEEMMNGILEEAQEMIPTIMPFTNLGSDDPAADPFGNFDNGSTSENRMKNAGLYHDEALEL